MTQTSHDTAEPPPAGGFRREGVHDLRDLRRSVTDRKVAGVAGGLGRHFNIDPTVLRVAFVVLALFGGAGLLLYGVAYLVVPEEGHDHAVITTSPSTRSAVLLGAVVLAAALVLSNTFGHWWWAGAFPWPIAVVALVVALIWMNRGKKVNTQPTPPPPPPPSAEEEWTGVPPPPPAYSAPPSAYQPPAPRTRRGPLLFAPTLALLAVALGSLGLYDALGGSVVAAAYPALALTVIGAMLLLGAWFGRPGGLIALGLAATVALAGTSAADATIGGNREIHPAPTSAAAVHDHYFLRAGQIRLDLSQVSPGALDGRTITVRTRAGEVDVLLPSNLRAHVTADVSLGEVSIDGHTYAGPSTHIVRDIGTGPSTVDLDLGTFVGRVAVHQVPSHLPPAQQGAGLTQGAA